MTAQIITWLETELAKAKTLLANDLTAIEQEILVIEQKLAAGLKPLAAKIASTIGSQGLTILEQAMSDIATVIISGGNVGVTLSALIPTVTAQVKADLKQDAATAAHGAAELLIAALPVSSTTVVIPVA